MALGAKRIETRSWGTKYRGPLAIHAAKGWPIEFIRLCGAPPFVAALRAGYGPGAADILAAQRGHIIAVVELEEISGAQARLSIAAAFRGALLINGHERSFGDFSPGRFAWETAFARPLARPIPAKGALGLWEFDSAAIEAALSEARR
jgi:hypothetical protein